MTHQMTGLNRFVAVVESDAERETQVVSHSLRPSISFPFSGVLSGRQWSKVHIRGKHSSQSNHQKTPT